MENMIRGWTVVSVGLYAAGGVTGCVEPRTKVEADAWSTGFSPPETLDTDRVHLEPLAPKHAELDHAAAQSSREHLQRTLHWGEWPKADMTVEENRGDLARHWREFEERKGYAYTVLTPDRGKCLGCVYLSPRAGEPGAAELAYWVIQAEVSTGLDRYLLESVLKWIESSWPFEKVYLSEHRENARGIEIARGLALRRGEAGDAEHVVFVWERR